MLMVINADSSSSWCNCKLHFAFDFVVIAFQVLTSTSTLVARHFASNATGMSTIMALLSTF
jgi:hypothetical protein